MRCSLDVKRSMGGSSYKAPCHNPAEFEVRRTTEEGRPLGACRHHLAPLVRRMLHGGRYAAPAGRLDVRLVDLDA